MCDGNVQSVSLQDERDRKKNSNFRELKAILFALQSFCSHLRNEDGHGGRSRLSVAPSLKIVEENYRAKPRNISSTS